MSLDLSNAIAGYNSDDHPDNDLDALQDDPTKSPFDLSFVPDELIPYLDDSAHQSDILATILGTPLPADTSKEQFERTPIRKARLSKLKRNYEDGKIETVDSLSRRHKVLIDDEYLIPFGSDRVCMDAEESMIDYHLTVANHIGLSSLLLNAASGHRFTFAMDLKKPYIQFRGKNAMLGFDPAGRMLYIGQSNAEDVFLAMAPNEFLRGRSPPVPAGHSSASTLMSTRHYRQIVMLFAHFLARLPLRAFINNPEGVYTQDLRSPAPNFNQTTSIMAQTNIRLNFEEVSALDSLIAADYDSWVENAPGHWKADGFLQKNKPIVVTSRYGQNARVAITGNELQEAEDWQSERDYSRLAFVTFAIATSVRCTEILDWEPIDTDTLLSENTDGIFDDKRPELRRPIADLENFPLLDDNGKEIFVYNLMGDRIPRRLPLASKDAPECGVLVDLHDIQGLYKPCTGSAVSHNDDEEDRSSTSTDAYDFSDQVRVYAYPLAFLRTAGNVQANGIPSCLYPTIAQINDSVGKTNPNPRAHLPSRSGSGSDSSHLSTDDEDAGSFDREPSRRVRPLRAVKPVSSQIYNYISHRVASRAGLHDSQQGTVTAAVAGGFADTGKDKRTALEMRFICNQDLPSERFSRKISHPDTPVCCRVEVVYSVDVRALKDPSGRSIFNDIVVPLARSWEEEAVRKVLQEYLVVFKPNIFPAIYNWVSFPITTLIRSLYENEMQTIGNESRPCPFRLELLAALERTLCYSHTGNAAVLATSLMNPLGLSRGLVKDGYPVLLKIFTQPTIPFARMHSFEVDKRAWPLKDGYPAVASRRAQILTYSLEHFMTYQANLRINYIEAMSPSQSFQGVTEVDAKALSISKIAFDAFFEDTKRLVVLGVRADIQRRKSMASSEDELIEASTWAGLREAALASWVKVPFPLAYGHKERSDVYKLVLQAVSPSAASLSDGLPNWNDFYTSGEKFAASLFGMSKPDSPDPPKAPVLRNGSFLPVLKVAHSALQSVYSHEGDERRSEKIEAAFWMSLHHFKVDFYPAPKLTPSRQGNARGAPNTKPVFNSWGYLGDLDSKSNRVLGRASASSSLSDRRTILPPAEVAFNNATARDHNAPWSANGLNLETLHSVLKKVSLPDDFHNVALTGVQYVDDTYRWVRDNYNGAKPLHHLALLVSIMTASTLLPRLFVPPGLGYRFENASPSEVRRIYEDIDWITKESRGGMVEPSIFIAMFTSYIIAIYEEESPLRKRLGVAQKGGLGDEWRDKNSAKGITYTTLIRLGVVWGRGKTAYEKGRFKTHWGCHPPGDIKVLYNALRKKLLDSGPFSPFDALTLLIGDRNARIFCDNSRVRYATRPPVERTPPANNIENLYAVV